MNEIRIATYGTTTIAWCPIVDNGGGRRADEHAAVTRLVQHLLGDVVVEHDENGAPYVSGTNISISHSRCVAAVAIDAVRRIGIDVEEWRPALLRVAERYMSPSEMQTYDTQAAMLHVWTVKEAVYKVVGERAYDFDTAIEVYPDYAVSCGTRFDIHTLDIDGSHLTLVVPA